MLRSVQHYGVSLNYFDITHTLYCICDAHKIEYSVCQSFSFILKFRLGPNLVGSKFSAASFIKREASQENPTKDGGSQLHTNTARLSRVCHLNYQTVWIVIDSFL